MTDAVDPIRLEVLWRNLLSLTDEAAWNLTRTAFSHAVREAWDFGVMLYDRRGRMVAQNTGVAGKNALWHPLPAEIVRRFEHDLAPGDVFVTNEPHLSDGHLYDVSIVRPIFHADRLVALVECVEHLSEIGGTISASPRDLYEEGLVIPLLRVARRDRIADAVEAFIAANVRAPDQVLGDIRAMIGAVATSDRLLGDLLERRGGDDPQPEFDAIIDRSDAWMRSGIRTHLPGGTYRHRVSIDAGDDDDVIIDARVTVDDDHVHVDLSGSSPQAAIGINCPLNFTYSWVAYAVKCLAAPDAPVNHGCFLPIRVTAPEGTIVNPFRTAPVRSRGVVGVQLPMAIFGALGDVAADRVLAGCCAPTWAVRVHGRDQTGSTISELIVANGGMGARGFADGLSCTPFPNNAANVPIELIEERLPLRVIERSLVRDSGGPGTFRGGLGQRLVLQVLEEYELRVTVQTNQIRNAPRGRMHGLDGARGRLEVNGVPVRGNESMVLRGGDRLSLVLPGGGGVGDPHERARQSIRDDLDEDVVSIEAAFEHYAWSTDG